MPRILEQRLFQQVWGRGLVLSFVFLCGALAPQAAFGGDAPAPKPKAVVKEPTHNFGTVVQGTKIVHDFKITNEGSAPFSIQRVVPSCGCTASSATASAVLPGGHALIHVEFDSTGFSGEKTKSVRVLTSDSEHPAIDVFLKGQIEPEVSLEPAYVSFGDLVVGQGGSGTKSVTVVVREGSPLDLGEVKSWSKFVKVKEISGGAKKKVIGITLAEGLPAGEFRDRVVINTKSGDTEGAINIPLVASVKSEVALQPANVSFGVVDGKEPIVRKVTLNNFGSRPVAIREIRSSEPALRGTFKAIEPGKNFIIELSLDPKLVKRDFRASVEVVTDRDDLGTMALNVYGITPPQL